ncbi:MAG: hypothetical protein ACI3YE_06340 [Candidatus Avispirillum sp.]
MKIEIAEDGKMHTVRVPITVVAKMIKSNNTDPESGAKIAKALRVCKKKYPKLKLVEVESEDGEKVDIFL